MSNESTPQSNSVQAVASRIAALMAEHGSGVQVIFVARRLAAGDTDRRAVIVATAEEIARSAGLNRWASWGIVWEVDPDNVSVHGTDESNSANPSLHTVISDLVETGRSNGVILCAIGDLSTDDELAAILARGAAQAEQHDLLAVIVD